MQTLESIIIIALFTLFLHCTTWEGMINHWIHKVAFNWPAWIKKPLFDCPICMAPWYGSLLILAGLINVSTAGHAILILFAAGGLNTVLIYLISADKEITKELKEDE